MVLILLEMFGRILQWNRHHLGLDISFLKLFNSEAFQLQVQIFIGLFRWPILYQVNFGSLWFSKDWSSSSKLLNLCARIISFDQSSSLLILPEVSVKAFHWWVFVQILYFSFLKVLVGLLNNSHFSCCHIFFPMGIFKLAIYFFETRNHEHFTVIL